MKKIFYFFLLLLLSFNNSFSQGNEFDPIVPPEPDGLDVWSLNKGNIGRIWALAVHPTNQNIMYAAGIDSGVYKSINYGVTWTSVNNGLTHKYIQCLAVAPSNPNVVYAGTNQGNPASGVYRTTDGGANWVLVNTGITETALGIQTLAVHPANSNIAWVGVFDGVANSTVGLFKTTDGGANWFASSNGVTINKNILAILVNPLNPNTLYCGTSFQVTTTNPVKIYKSYDGGVNWVEKSVGLPNINNPVRCMAMSSIDTSVILAGLFLNDTTGGAYVTVNAGETWVKKHNGAPPAQATLIRSCAIKPGSNTEFFLGIDRSTPDNFMGVYRTTNQGNNWTQFTGGTLAANSTIRALAFSYNGTAYTLFAGNASTSANGIYEFTFNPIPVELISFNASQNNNTVLLNWATATETNNKGFEIQKREFKNQKLANWETIGFVNGYGTSTEKHNYSFTDMNVNSGNFSYRLKQIDFDGKFSYSKEIQIENNMAGNFNLSQNYPNPFYSSSNSVLGRNNLMSIQFTVGSQQLVSLKVYDALGNEVAELVNDVKQTGSYNVSFNPSNLASGIYYYKMQAGEFSAVKKLILIK